MSSVKEKEGENDLPVLFHLWLPIFFLVVFIGIKFLDNALFLEWVDGENGAIELLTPLVLFVGIFYGVRIITFRKVIKPVVVFSWVCLVSLACVYFAGEELSWGQQFFQWQTPEGIKKLNDQDETNLHNMSSWFDQKPRLLLELWVLIGGVILPIRRFLDKQHYDEQNWQYWFWPSSYCFPSAVLAILVKFPERVKDLFGLEPFQFEMRYSEMQELYFAFFLSLYLMSIYFRAKNI